jgi:acetoin utilization deacetylase AcuC-like enzyme
MLGRSIPFCAKVLGMRVLAVEHPSFMLHEQRIWHPERPDRLIAARAGLELAPVDIVTAEALPIPADLLETLHTEEYVTAIEGFCAAGGGDLDPDTYAVAGSWEAAIRSAGAGPVAVDRLTEGAAEVAFCLVRPPGHHALANRAMGFCIFNNAALTARQLADRGDKVVIVDWDVHHGNGTQDLFIADGNILYISLHQFPFYPGGGWLDEYGYGPGAGMTVNIPVPAGTMGDVYREAFRRVILPVARQFGPDWLLVSSGYDGHRDDPLAGINLIESDYAYMANSLVGIVPDGRTVVFLEGGYDLNAIQGSVAATFSGFAGDFNMNAPAQGDSEPAAWRSLELVEKGLGDFWKVR